MKKLLPLLLLFSAASFAQAPADLPIMGEISQIVGKTKVYVAGATSDERKIIVRAFDSEKKKVPFVIVGDPAEAELFMNFGELTRMTDNTTRNRKYQERDELEVYFMNADGKRVIVFTDTETLDASNGFALSFPNSWNLTKNFFKAYNKAVKERSK